MKKHMLLVLLLTGMVLMTGCATKSKKCQINHVGTNSIIHKDMGMGSSEIMEIIQETCEIIGD